MGIFSRGNEGALTLDMTGLLAVFALKARRCWYEILV